MERIDVLNVAQVTLYNTVSISVEPQVLSMYTYQGAVQNK